MRLLIVVLGFLLGLAAACGDATIYTDCDDPGPHEFILAGTFRTASEFGTPDNGLTLSDPMVIKTIVIDEAVETLRISYVLDGAAVVETFDIVNKRSDYNE